jgi:hypothetical protein
MMQIHRRQFIAGPKRVRVNNDWISLELAPALYLSHCNTLPVFKAIDLDNVQWYILGLAVQTDPDRPDPVSEISASRTQQIKELYPSWAGRWVLVGNNEIHMDASGMLGCFYRVKNNHAGSREVWVSSSAALLADIAKGECRKIGSMQTLKSQMNWYPPPVSGFQGISRLLPSQILSLSSGKAFVRPLIPEVPEYTDYSQILDALQERLLTSVRRASQKYKTIWVPLSAGYDSRLVLALALHAGLSVKTYTFKKEYEWQRAKLKKPITSLALKADMVLPPLIAKEVGVEHRWIPKGAYSKEAVELFDRHTGEHTRENDRVYFSHGQFDWTRNTDLFLRGHVFAVGKCLWWKLFPQRLAPGELPKVDEIVEKFHLSKGSIQSVGIAQWLDWVSQTGREKIDWRDRFEIEQRLAGWNSCLDQALDLIEGEKFYAVNSGSMFHLLLSIPEDIRGKKQHHIDLIERLEPKLLRLPINPPDPSFHKMKMKILRKLRSLNSLPRSSVVPYVCGKLKGRIFR